MSTTLSRRLITDTEYALFLKRAPEVGIAQACRELNRTPQALRYHTLKHGLTITRLPTSFLLNPELFESISTPEVAYVLGLIWADGHMRPSYYSLWIELDKADLLMVKPAFDKTGRWHYNERTRRGRTKPIASLNVSSKRVRAVLDQCDYLVKSQASPSKILERIPTHLHPLFWRGYIDGDGCFYVKGRVCQFSLAGAFDQDWTAMLQLCQHLGINATVQHVSLKTGKSSSVRITGRMDIERLGDWVYSTYPTDNIGLPRKHAKFLAVKACCEVSRNGRYARKYSEAIIPPVSS